MTNEEKQLLLKDLCARLRYGVRMKELIPTNGIELELYLTSIYKDNVQVNTNNGGVMASVIDAFKPYLRPMSSMTEEEDKDWQLYKSRIVESCDELLEEKIAELHDWFNLHHFDYLGLIEKGLALEAPEGMYN